MIHTEKVGKTKEHPIASLDLPTSESLLTVLGHISQGEGQSEHWEWLILFKYEAAWLPTPHAQGRERYKAHGYIKTLSPKLLRKQLNLASFSC